MIKKLYRKKWKTLTLLIGCAKYLKQATKIIFTCLLLNTYVGFGVTVEDMINFEKGVQSGLIPKPPSNQDKNKFIQNGVEKAKKHCAISQKKEEKLADKSQNSKSSGSSSNRIQKICTIEQNEQ